MDANKAEKTLTRQSNETGLEKETTYRTLSLIQYGVQYLLLISRFLHFAASFCRKSNILSHFPPCDYLPRPDVLHLCFLSFSQIPSQSVFSLWAPCSLCQFVVDSLSGVCLFVFCLMSFCPVCLAAVCWSALLLKIQFWFWKAQLWEPCMSASWELHSNNKYLVVCMWWAQTFISSLQPPTCVCKWIQQQDMDLNSYCKHRINRSRSARILTT